MEYPTNADVGCLLVGEYVDEADISNSLSCKKDDIPQGEVVRPRMVGSYLDIWGVDSELKEFKAILKQDRQTVIVYGHGLKPVMVGENACFGVWVRSKGEELLVALFPLENTLSVFGGTIQLVGEPLTTNH